MENCAAVFWWHSFVVHCELLEEHKKNSVVGQRIEVALLCLVFAQKQVRHNGQNLLEHYKVDGRSLVIISVLGHDQAEGKP